MVQEPGPPNLTLLAPQLVSPGNGQIFTTIKGNASVTIALNWTAVPGATSYELGFSNGAFTTVSGTSRTVDRKVGKWAWKVRAIDSNGVEGPWSPWFSFEVKLITLQPAP